MLICKQKIFSNFFLLFFWQLKSKVVYLLHNHNKIKMEKYIAKELFEVCYDKGIYLTLGVKAGIVTCVIGDICYLSYLDQYKLDLGSNTQRLPIWELLEIAKKYNNEE